MRRIQSLEAATSIRFGPGCNKEREIVDGLVVCPRGDECACWALAEAAGLRVIEVPDKDETSNAGAEQATVGAADLEDAPPEEPVEVDWKAAGVEAARSSAERALPAELKGRPRSADSRAWFAGYDEAKAASTG